MLDWHVVDHVSHGAVKEEQNRQLPHFEFTPQDRAYQQGIRERAACEALQAVQKSQGIVNQIGSCRRKVELALEAAFDNDLEKLTALMREGVGVDTSDLHGNSLLSEAAAGGAEQCVQMLLVRGADANSLGRYHRTPLWRAANAGHAAVVCSLLRGGADPRIIDENAMRPPDVANGEDSRMLLECWDIRVTKTLRQKKRASLPKQEKERLEKEERQQQELEDALKEVQRKACIAKTEIDEKRHVVLSYARDLRDHQDNLQASTASLQELQMHFEREQVGLQILMDVYRDLQWEEQKVRLKRHDFQSLLDRRRAQAMKTQERASHVKDAEEFSGFDAIVQLRDLQSVLATDFHGNRQEDGRWPMFYDPSGKVRAFFDHSGGAVFDALELRCLQFSEDKAQRQRLQLALLRQFRRGGHVVIDLGGDLTQMSFVEEAFNAISPSLFSIMTDRAVLYSYLLPQRFRSWSHCDVGFEENLDLDFDEQNLRKFVLIFLVKNASQDEQPVQVNQSSPTSDANSDDGWLMVQGSDMIEELSAFYTVRVSG